ncbi:MAG: hypothetical protein J0M02_13075 [Planctomycetes bacterium]|nr:hypothetical protein [Planctomycetota bacterium]
MPDDAAPSQAEASLDDLERRLASFESATKRLNRNVGGMQEPEPATVGHSSPPRPATRRLSESGAPRSDDISGLRPAVQAQGPQTGALTARNRPAGAPTASATPGFTSAFGKPSIAVVPTHPATNAHAAREPRTTQPPAWHRIGRLGWIAIGAGAALLLFLAVLPRLFTTVGAAVWADEVRVVADRTGSVDAVLAGTFATVEAGQALARIGGVDLRAPESGTVVRPLVTTGVRIAAGEPVAVLARPGSTRIVAVQPTGTRVAVGDAVRIELMSERRSIDGSVEQVLPAGSPGPWTGNGPPPDRLVIVAMPSPHPVQLGQSARVTILGAPTAGRQLLFALRQVLPW